MDTLIDVELAQFTDTTVTLDTSAGSPSTAPSGADKTITTLEDTAYALTAADFGFSDANDSPPHSLQAVIITTAAHAGILTLNGAPVPLVSPFTVADINAGLLQVRPSHRHATAPPTPPSPSRSRTPAPPPTAAPTSIPLPIPSPSMSLRSNDAPSGSNGSITATEDIPYAFSTTNFGLTDANDIPAHALLAVRLTTLPLAGTMRLNGAAVSAGQTITAVAINAGLLTFVAAANANGAGYSSFSFQVQDNGGNANGGIDLDPTPKLLTINVTPVNDAPTGGLTINNTNPQVSQSLSVASTVADVDGMPNPISYQWQSSANGSTWTHIDSATSTSYTVTAAQSGLLLRVRATFIDGFGTSEVVLSAPTAAVTSGAINGTSAADSLSRHQRQRH